MDSDAVGNLDQLTNDVGGNHDYDYDRENRDCDRENRRQMVAERADTDSSTKMRCLLESERICIVQTILF